MFLKIYCDRVELQPFGLVNLGNKLQVLHLMIGSSNTGSLVYFVAAIIATCTRWHHWSNVFGFLLMRFPKLCFLQLFFCFSLSEVVDILKLMPNVYFVKRLLNKDHRKRMTAAQALAQPWLRDENPGLLLDFSVYKLVKSYIRASPFRRSTLKALSKAIPDEELVFLKAQFMLLDPKDGGLSSFTTALTRYATDAIMESRLPDILNTMQPLVQKKLDFEEFCTAAVSVYQLEALEEWEQIATSAFEQFVREGNRIIYV